jgi:hypothetical protein
MDKTLFFRGRMVEGSFLYVKKKWGTEKMGHNIEKREGNEVHLGVCSGHATDSPIRYA